MDVCAYAVMSNHTHLVLRINKQKADALSVDEIIHRWHKLYKGMLLARRYTDPTLRDLLSAAELDTVNALADVYRKRLSDISWFMRLLNEYIARQANKEDDCTGHFWEGRFKSQALLDEAALAACMAYVDLNPVRACQAKTPKTSPHTSIRKRLLAAGTEYQPRQLLPFTGEPKSVMQDGLPFRAEDYFALVELTGRHFHPEKPGQIDCTASPILERAGIEHTHWYRMVSGIETSFKTRVSLEQHLSKHFDDTTFNSA